MLIFLLALQKKKGCQLVMTLAWTQFCSEHILRLQVSIDRRVRGRVAYYKNGYSIKA